MTPSVIWWYGRFIPARAGNALTACHAGWHQPVHPRACGERDSSCSCVSYVTGSSPRVRGTHGDDVRSCLCVRFIPARAGNAAIRPCSATCRSVHPRACGERQSAVQSQAVKRGSSPRVRGTPHSRRQKTARWRFIPARAGNAVTSAHPPTTMPVHPRACGERSLVSSSPSSPIGSSPRVRGTRCRARGDGWGDRFIPARAGNAPP